jgi:LysR family transcriptional repressor of citA
MDIEWLRTFVTAAEAENFHRAAERLHLSQPTVTAQIQKLEQHWGMPLFERIGRQVRLSAAGQCLLKRARSLLREYEASLEELSRMRQGYDTRLTLAVSPLVATTYLPYWVREHAERHPHLEFSLQISESEQILGQLLDREADLGLTRQKVVHPNVVCTPLYADPVVLVAPFPEGDLDAPPPSADEVLGRYPVFTHNHPEYWDVLVSALRQVYPGMRTMRISQVHVTLHFIAERMGVSFLPWSTVRRDILRGRLEEVPFSAVELPTAHTYLLTPCFASPAARSFADFVVGYMRDRPRG